MSRSLATFVSAVRIDDDGKLAVAFILDQINNKPPAETGDLSEFRMVGPEVCCTNQIQAIPGGFVIFDAA